jgi:diacylglycerol kinase family enzyme
MRYRKALIVTNPYSGRGRAVALGADLQKLLTDAGIETEHIGVGEAPVCRAAIADAVRRGCDIVVLVGGDGTLRECLDPLVENDVPVLIAHAGTSNLIATFWRLPARPKGLVKLIEAGEVRGMDVAYLDGDPFVLAAGFGLATDVIRDANRELKRYLGPLAYLWSFLRNVGRKRVQVELRLDDGRTVIHRAKLVLFANCAETLGQVDIVPDASVDDGKIDVAVFEFANLWQVAKLIGFAVTARWRRFREAVFYRTSKAEVWLEPPLPVQIDGDVFEARSYFKIEVRQGALRVLAPRPRAPILPREWFTEMERRLELLRTGSRQAPAEILRALWDEYVVRSRRSGKYGEERAEGDGSRREAR